MQDFAEALRAHHFGRIDVPYAAFLGIRFERDDDEVRLVMAYGEHLLGAPGRLHGGTVAGLLELAGQFEQPRDVTATAAITRLGRRIINVRALAWQYERARPIAAANLNLMVDRPEPDADG